ncbi:Hypothetical protein A7982_01014 [Minicystis rosea]|nr:Hypothetical protein A7982_01014 [Minicystis rosea]
MHPEATLADEQSVGGGSEDNSNMGHPSIRKSIVARVVTIACTLVIAAGCSSAPAEPAGEACVYPRSSYGFVPGDVAPPTLSWKGTAESGEITTVSLGDYYDCDGSKGINAILIDQSTMWCGACQALARKLGENVRGEWKERGIRLITLITQSGDATPATVDTARIWKRRFGLDGSAVVADPEKSFRSTAGQIAAPYPYEVLIDPRTMKIISVDAGFDGRGDFPAAVELARRNAGSD